MREEKQLIYKTNHTKLAGGYIIDKKAAEKTSFEESKHLFLLPIDSLPPLL